MFLGVLDQHKFQHNQHLTINSWCHSSGRCQDTGAEIVPNQYPQDVTNAKRPTWIERRRRPENGGGWVEKRHGLGCIKVDAIFSPSRSAVCVCVRFRSMGFRDVSRLWWECIVIASILWYCILSKFALTPLLDSCPKLAATTTTTTTAVEQNEPNTNSLSVNVTS